MIIASETKQGQVIKLEDRPYKILEVIRHAGSGQMHGYIGLKVKDMLYGHVSEKHFKPGDKLDKVELTKRQMDFLYSDAESAFFIDPVSFEQVMIRKEQIGTQDRFLAEGMKITVELLGEEPISIEFPKVVELKVTQTGPGMRSSQDNTMKPAILENGIEILVPQFIETGETVRVDTEKVKYLDRVTARKM